MISKLILVATAGAVCIYIFLRGVMDFYTEAFGTLLLSPTIYIRLAPSPLSELLLRMCTTVKGFDLMLCGIPVAMFVAALIAGYFAHERRSIPLALISSLLVSSIFIVYHSVKHLGFTVASI